MTQFKRILVVVDPTTSEQPAMTRAAWLARKTGASIELFICDYDQYLSGERFFDSQSMEKARENLIDSHRKRLHKLAQGIAADGISVFVDASWDHPLHDGIVRKVMRSKPDIVFKDTHYHAAIRRSIFSNTDWNLIRDCPAPLLLVKPEGFEEPLSIIAAVDPVHERDKPAELDHRILDTARTLAEQLGGDLHVLHGFDPSPAYAVSADSMAFPISAPIKEMMEALKTKHQAAVEDLLEGRNIPESRVHVLEGDTREVMIGLVQQLDADVVVMGAVSRGALQRLVLGSTAEHVLDHVPCDVLIVKPAGFETKVSSEP